MKRLSLMRIRYSPRETQLYLVILALAFVAGVIIFAAITFDWMPADAETPVATLYFLAVIGMVVLTRKDRP